MLSCRAIERNKVDVQIHGATGNLATLFQAVCGVVVLVLAEHEVLVVILAVSTNEESSRLQGSGSGANFRVGRLCGSRCRVNELAGRQ